MYFERRIKMQLFWVFFGVGVVYTVISFCLGQLFDFFDFDSDFEIGSNISPMKPAVIAAFVTIFGGVGIILMKSKLSFIISALIAFTIAVTVSFVIYRFIIVKLYQSQNTSAVERQKLIGQKAKVTLTIRQGGYGKITYVVNGNIYNSPAKTDSGDAVEKGTDVEIIYIDKNTYYVKKCEEEILCQEVKQ